MVGIAFFRFASIWKDAWNHTAAIIIFQRFFRFLQIRRNADDDPRKIKDHDKNDQTEENKAQLKALAALVHGA